MRVISGSLMTVMKNPPLLVVAAALA